AVVDGIVEEAVVRVPLVLAGVLRHPVREDHVVEPLVGVARHPRVRHDDLHVVRERTRPVPLAITLEVLLLLDEAEEHVRAGDSHIRFPRGGVALPGQGMAPRSRFDFDAYGRGSGYGRTRP